MLDTPSNSCAGGVRLQGKFIFLHSALRRYGATKTGGPINEPAEHFQVPITVAYHRSSLGPRTAPSATGSSMPATYQTLQNAGLISGQ